MSFKYWQEAVNDYEKLFETGEEYDVIIYAGENENVKELHAHSNILRTRSQYFRIALSSKWAEKENGKFIFKKPNISPCIFKIILSGNIDLTQLEALNVFKLLMAVDELCIRSLFSCIQEHLIEYQDELLKENPTEILEIIYKNELFTDLWNSCLDKICNEPEILINYDKFTSLKASIMKKLFKRDDFYLEEIVIWESLIKWCLAQHPTISKDVAQWDKDETNMMGKTIHDFIHLIRFYQISSDDFFYKVIPYKKLLPKQLIHEISEFHIVSNKKFNELNNDSPFPRQSHLIEYDTVLIISRHFDIFASWIDKEENSHYNIKNIPYEFDLIYRSSRDGKSASAFHAKCDNKGATIVIAKIKNSEQIVGGYNPDSWETIDSYKVAEDSFIFTFKNRKYLQTAKVSYVNKDSSKYAINIHSTRGPGFGHSPGDLFCSKNGTTWESHPYSYPKIDDIPSSFKVEEVECYQVTLY